MSHCDRCPLKRHRRPCPAQWDGCGGACALVDAGGMRHELVKRATPSPTAAEVDDFRGMLPSAFWERENLADETVTLFVPLSGRDAAWDTTLRPFLDGQTWPRAQTRLVLADTSQREDFGAKVRAWLDGAGYPDARCYEQTVGEKGLNAKPRPNDGGFEVNTAMRLIYARMAAELTTRFVLVVEDDNGPPADALGRLLRGMDARTAAVSGLYRGREPMGNWVCWSHRPGEVQPAPGPAVPVAGSGFGTLLIKRDPWLVGEDFAHVGPEPFPYDIGFAYRVEQRGGVWKADRSVLVEHAGAPPILPVHRAIAAGLVPTPVQASTVVVTTAPPDPLEGLPAAEALRRSAAARNCPHRGCKIGCQSAACAVGKGDRQDGREATLAHCVRCVAESPEPSAPRPQRVGIITPLVDVGGAEVWILNLLDHVLGVEWAGVVVREDAPRDAGMAGELARRVPVHYGGIHVDALYRDCDVVVVWGIPPADLRLPPRPRRAKVVLTSHGVGEWTAGLFRDTDLVDALVGVSAPAVAWMSEADRARAVVIPNAYDPGRVAPRRSRADVRASWGVGESETVIGYLGRLALEKNAAALVDAARSLPAGWRMVIVGDGPERAALEAAAAVLPVVFTGATSHPGDALAAFDRLVMPSWEEACSLVLLEAWAAGCPVLSTPVGIVPEHPDLVRVLPDRPDGAAIVAAVAADLGDEAGTRLRVERARAVAAAEFAPERFGRQWAELIRGLSG